MDFKTSEKYSRAAGLYDLMEFPIERLLFKKLRTEAISYARGNTLEVGVGTGKNLQYYNREVILAAVDFSRGMLRETQKNIESAGFVIESVENKALDIIRLIIAGKK